MLRIIPSLGIFAFALASTSAEAVSLRVTNDSTIELRGTTNVTAWKCTNRSVGGTLQIDASPAVLDALLTSTAALPEGTRITALPNGTTVGNPAFSAALPVRAFDCGNPIMERDLRRALKESVAPEIRFEYQRLRTVTTRRTASARTAWAIVADVELSLAGCSRTISMELIAERVAPDRFRVTGAMPLKMTDFRIEPPIGLLGLIRARDGLTVHIELTLELTR